MHGEIQLTSEERDKILGNLIKPEEEEENPLLLDYSICRETNAIGYLGDYYVLYLTYADPHSSHHVERQLFIKALPQQSAEIEKEAIFRKEAWLYDNLLAEMQKYSTVKWSPNCYFTRDDLCVMEDIKLRGYSAPKSVELDDIEMRQLLKGLAAFHAASLFYEERTQINIGVRFGSILQEITVSPDIAWFTTGLSAVLDILRTHPKYQTIADLQFIDCQLTGIVERVYDQTSSSAKYRNVLCHRDTWAGNIFFHEDSRMPALFIDFQTCRYSPPAIDLSFSLCMNLTPKNRKRLEWNYLDMYYEWLSIELEQFGLDVEQILSKDELLESYKEFRLFGAVYRAVAATIIKVPPECVTNDFKYVDRSVVLSKLMKKNANLRIYMEQCCEEVMETAIELSKLE